MANGLIIHVTVGAEKRTEFFSAERISFGASDASNLQIRTAKIEDSGIWLELEKTDDVYRVLNFKENLNLKFNGEPLRRFVAVRDGDVIAIESADISFAFFTLAAKSSLVAAGESHVAPFIEDAALESAYSPKRDDAKTFLRQFVRELSREINWATKLIVLAVAVAFLGGILYLGFEFNRELRETRQQAEQQNQIIKNLEDKIGQTNDQLGSLDKSNKDIIKTVSLAPNLRVEYGNGVCLIVGVYDLVDRKSGKILRYPDPTAVPQDPYEPAPPEDGSTKTPAQPGLTTEGSGTPVEYDFIGTGFHVGGGYIVTNRHVLQPWEEDDMIKQMIRASNGKARIKRLVVYFPNLPQPIPLKVQQVGTKEDLGIATIDPTQVSPDIPVLPLDTSTDSVAIGKTVVTMGYPNGPDRLLAMVDDDEAKSINARFGNSRQAILNYLSQSKKIVPLTTIGAITDLDSRRIVHDAKTAEGGSGAPLFGQSGKVIGVNFGVFTENNAANMAIPIKYAIELLKQAGWKSPDETKPENTQTQTASANPNSNTSSQGKNP
ncbi:MAG: trypsin-like peptidase domain-containing protein [Pyrinomonadaceae bacterium]